MSNLNRGPQETKNSKFVLEDTLIYLTLATILPAKGQKYVMHS